MGYYINVVIVIILVVILVVGAPLLISYTTDINNAKTLILNDIALFLDTVTDTRQISQADLDNLALDINSRGIACNIIVKRLVPITQYTPTGDINTLYINQTGSDAIGGLNTSDRIQVTVKEIGISVPRRIIYSLIKLDIGAIDITLAASVR